MDNIIKFLAKLAFRWFISGTSWVSSVLVNSLADVISKVGKMQFWPGLPISLSASSERVGCNTEIILNLILSAIIMQDDIKVDKV